MKPLLFPLLLALAVFASSLAEAAPPLSSPPSSLPASSSRLPHPLDPLYHVLLFLELGSTTYKRGGQNFGANLLAGRDIEVFKEIPASASLIATARGLDIAVLATLIGGAAATIGGIAFLFASGSVGNLTLNGAELLNGVVMAGAGIVTAASLLILIRSGIFADSVERHNQGRIELFFQNAKTPEERRLALALESDMILRKSDGFLHRQGQRRPSLSPWHEDFLKEDPKLLETTRFAWRSRLASIVLLSIGGAALAGGIVCFAVDPKGLSLSPGPAFIPPEVTISLLGGGGAVFFAGATFGILSTNAYLQAISTHNHKVFLRLFSPSPPPPPLPLPSASSPRLHTLLASER